MVRRALIVLCVGFMCIFAASCGQSYDLQSITVAPSSPNVEGIGGTQALVVTAQYSNTKTAVVTVSTTYDRSNLPPATVTLSQSGILEAVGAACTWHAMPTNAGDTQFDYSTDPYPVTASYSENGITKTFQVFVSVASAAGCYDGQAFLAPAGFLGN
jgi:hypothetical protein